MRTHLGKVSPSAVLIGALLLLLAFPLEAQASPIGQVKTVVGAAEVVRAGQVIVAKVGLPLFESDLVRTGADGRLGVTLRDETRLAFGPGTQLMLAKFAFEPAEEKLGLTVRLIRGTLSFISGRIAKLSPASVTIETPTSVIGVRGTHLVLKVD
ncbi:MAG: FecR domain-containing protein [Gemmatimonadaceae bacterium]